MPSRRLWRIGTIKDDEDVLRLKVIMCSTTDASVRVVNALMKPVQCASQGCCFTQQMDRLKSKVASFVGVFSSERGVTMLWAAQELLEVHVRNFINNVEFAAMRSVVMNGAKALHNPLMISNRRLNFLVDLLLQLEMPVQADTFDDNALSLSLYQYESCLNLRLHTSELWAPSAPIQ